MRKDDDAGQHELAQLTWEEVRDLDRARHAGRACRSGAIEAHGPHLPLDTDVVIATAMARDGAQKLAAREGGAGWSSFCRRSRTAAATFAAAFQGTLSISGITVAAVIVDLARSLSGQGYPSFGDRRTPHLDPEHSDGVCTQR